MQPLQDAIKILKSKIKDAKPEAYWIDGSNYVFRLKTPGRLFGCNLVIVDGDKVKGVHPLSIDLNIKDMIKL